MLQTALDWLAEGFVGFCYLAIAVAMVVGFVVAMRAKVDDLRSPSYRRQLGRSWRDSAARAVRTFFEYGPALAPLWYWGYYKLPSFLHAIGREVSEADWGFSRAFTVLGCVLLLALPVLVFLGLLKWARSVLEQYRGGEIRTAARSFALLVLLGGYGAFALAHPDSPYSFVGKGGGNDD